MVFLSFPFDIPFSSSLSYFSKVEHINIVILHLLWFPCGCGWVLPVAGGGKREFYYSDSITIPIRHPAVLTFIFDIFLFAGKTKPLFSQDAFQQHL